MSHPFDATLKEILGQAPADLCGPFRLPKIEPVQTLNVDLSTISAATDVAVGFGAPPREIADLNLQSGPDPNVAARLLLYNAALHVKYKVPVRSILVLLRPRASVPGLNGKYTYTSGGKSVIFEYDLIRLWTEPVATFLGGGVGLLPMAPLCKMPPGKSREQSIREVVHEIDRRLGSLPDYAQAVRLMTASFVLTGMRVRKDRISSIYEGVRIMHQTTAWDQAIDEGFVKGEQKAILVMGRERLGDPDSDALAALKAIDDPDRLERMMAAAMRVRSWKAVLAVK